MDKPKGQAGSSCCRSHGDGRWTARRLIATTSSVVSSASRGSLSSCTRPGRPRGSLRARVDASRPSARPRPGDGRRPPSSGVRVRGQPVVRVIEDAVMRIAPLPERVHVHGDTSKVRHVMK
jgi:hypothetical protein